jgi:hypothetical protein
MKTRSKVAAAALVGATALAGAGATTAHAGGNVTVSLSSVSPQETVSITDLEGHDLTTQGLNLGSDNPLSSALSAPMEVTVTDANQTPSGFDIYASMTNLYQCTTSSGACTLPGTEPAGSALIPSQNVGVSYPASPLQVANVSALAAPLFTVAGSLPAAVCTDAHLLNSALSCGSSIPVTMTVKGVGQALQQAVNLATLNNLPVIPQAGATGQFQNPAYGYGAVPYRSQTTGSTLSVISGTDNTNASVLSTLQSQITGAGSVPSQYLDTNSLDTALQSALVTALGTVNTGITDVGDSVWVELENASSNPILTTAGVSPVSLATVEPSLAATLLSLGGISSTCTTPTQTLSCIVGVSGTYRSFPILNLSVPAGTSNGNFEGTLVFTGF